MTAALRKGKTRGVNPLSLTCGRRNDGRSSQSDLVVVNWLCDGELVHSIQSILF
jgi:hypothetical protein